MRLALLILLLTGVAAGSGWLLRLESMIPAVQPARTIWDGVFTTEQAQRGRAKYLDRCITCHKTDLSGVNRRLLSRRFMDGAREDNLNSLFARTRASMPPATPGILSDADYVDVLAFILESNGAPPGEAELRRDELIAIQFVLREGPQPLPRGARVVVVGCLISEGDSLKLTRASRPVRVRSYGQFTPAEIRGFEKMALGSQTLIVDTGYLQALDRVSTFVSHAGQKLVVKGAMSGEGVAGLEVGSWHSTGVERAVGAVYARPQC